ncbi:MAG: sensor histidine kinase [Phreatobacter sp.]|uniref:sensor histidine kinase n=1 Tax=Phreatobacter sp. TaxID=1966341 RepID=UPI001A4F6EDB|nr:sensor histidine kinase [Phreatobacter sp.]MBL8571674.1 sensor histidine kinase [Phreatobacter sp.]
MTAIASMHQLQATTAAASIQRFVDDIETHLRSLIGPSWASTGEDDRRVDALRMLRALPAVSTLRLVDPQGREQLRVSRLGPDIAGSGTDLGQTEAYGAARQRGRHVGAVYFLDGSEPYVTIHVGGASDRRGSVVADVNLKLISDTVAGIRIGEAGRAFLVDQQGRLISHPDISLVLRRTEVSSLRHVQVALGSLPSGTEAELVAGHDLDGGSVLSAHAFLPSLGWSVITELPRAEALAPVNAAIRLSVATLLGGLLAAIACGTLIARAMLRPIETLTVGAARIGAGDLDHRIAVSGANELAQLGDRFNDMAASLQVARDTLEEKVRLRTRELALANRAKSRFLASASHDLRQPLHALSLFVDELQTRPTGARRARLNDNLSDAVGRLNDMFDAILDASRIETGTIRPQISRFPLAPLLAALHAIFSPAAAARGLRLDIDDSAVWVESDRSLLQRILQNLVANAVRYTVTGDVRLVCSEADGQLTIAVIDTGPGISTDLQSEIFHEFFRASTPGQSGERGLGLGLFIVDSYAKLLGHPVSLRSEPGSGSCFEIRVPVVPAAGDDPLARSARR